jgi:hypothetical protein
MTISFKKKYISIILFTVVFFNLTFFNVPQANAWETFITAPMGVLLDQMIQIVKGVILGAAKKKALAALDQEMNHLLSGNSSGGAMFITNWNDYLVKEPRKKSDLYINAYIDNVTSGQGSIFGYASAGGEGVGGSYMSQMKQLAQKSTSDQPALQVTFRSDPSKIFSGKNPFQQVNLYFSGVNNAWGLRDNVRMEYRENLTDEKASAQSMSIAYKGFKGTEVSGYITNPGSLIEEAKAGVQNTGPNIIASAQDIPGILTAIVTQMITKSVEQGIGTVQANVHKEITDIKNNTTTQMNSAIETQGPAALYKH